MLTLQTDSVSCLPLVLCQSIIVKCIFLFYYCLFLHTISYLWWNKVVNYSFRWDTFLAAPCIYTCGFIILVCFLSAIWASIFLVISKPSTDRFSVHFSIVHWVQFHFFPMGYEPATEINWIASDRVLDYIQLFLLFGQLQAVLTVFYAMHMLLLVCNNDPRNWALFNRNLFCVMFVSQQKLIFASVISGQLELLQIKYLTRDKKNA